MKMAHPWSQSKNSKEEREGIKESKEGKGKVVVHDSDYHGRHGEVQQSRAKQLANHSFEVSYATMY